MNSLASNLHPKFKIWVVWNADKELSKDNSALLFINVVSEVINITLHQCRAQNKDSRLTRHGQITLFDRTKAVLSGICPMTDCYFEPCSVALRSSRSIVVHDNVVRTRFVHPFVILPASTGQRSGSVCCVIKSNNNYHIYCFTDNVREEQCRVGHTPFD